MELDYDYIAKLVRKTVLLLISRSTVLPINM